MHRSGFPFLVAVETMRSKKAIWNVVANLFQQLVAIVYGFIIPKIIISHFGSEVNGLISSITQFLGYIVLLESGFGPVVKAALYKPLAKKDSQQISNILFASTRFFRRISYIFIAYLLGLTFFYPIIVDTGFDFIFVASMVLITSISTFAEYYFGMAYRLFLQADQKGYIVSIIQAVSYILSLVLVVILAKLNAPVHIIKLATVLTFILRPILQNFYVRKKYQINLANADKQYNIKQKWDGLAQHVASVVHNNTDVVVLTLFSSLAEVSIYSVYSLVLTGVKNLVQAATNGLSSGFGDMIAKEEYKTLNKRFNSYEVIYCTIATIVYVCALLLIVPFVQAYMNGVTDANYTQWTFGILITLAEFVWAIRLPYSSTTLAAGHFKETHIGAWVEAGVNIVLSVILVWNFGLVGVAIGTLVAMIVRTVEFIYHTNKYILKRSIWATINKLVVLVIESLTIVFIARFIPISEMTSYLNWIIYALEIFAVAVLVVLPANYLLFKEDFKDILRTLRRVFKRKK